MTKKRKIDVSFLFSSRHLGIIHCQILEGKYSEAKQQIEFQNEVQTGNQAVRQQIVTMSS